MARGVVQTKYQKKGGASSHFQKNHDFVKISWNFMVFYWKPVKSLQNMTVYYRGKLWFSKENHEISWNFHKIMFFLKMRGGTPQKKLIFCLNNSPDYPERTADAFPVLQPDIRMFDSLNRGTKWLFFVLKFNSKRRRCAHVKVPYEFTGFLR